MVNIMCVCMYTVSMGVFVALPGTSCNIYKDSRKIRGSLMLHKLKAANTMKTHVAMLSTLTN